MLAPQVDVEYNNCDLTFFFNYIIFTIMSKLTNFENAKMSVSDQSNTQGQFFFLRGLFGGFGRRNYGGYGGYGGGHGYNCGCGCGSRW